MWRSSRPAPLQPLPAPPPFIGIARFRSDPQSSERLRQAGRRSERAAPSLNSLVEQDHTAGVRVSPDDWESSRARGNVTRPLKCGPAPDPNIQTARRCRSGAKESERSRRSGLLRLLLRSLRHSPDLGSRQPSASLLFCGEIAVFRGFLSCSELLRPLAADQQPTAE